MFSLLTRLNQGQSGSQIAKHTKRFPANGYITDILINIDEEVKVLFLNLEKVLISSIDDHA